MDRGLIRMLAISLCAHLAIVVIVRPRTIPVADAVTVISARLESRPDRPVAVESPVEQARAVESQSDTRLITPPAQPNAVPDPSPAVVPVQPVAPIIVPTVAQARDLEKPAVAMVIETPPKEMPRGGESTPPTLPSIPVMIDAHWYEARQLDVSPKASRPIKPAYPPDAVKRGLEGTVKLMLRVDEFGEVREAEVVEGDPPGVFDQSALDAFKAARFEAARQDRRPVRAIIYIRVHYELDE